MRADTGIKDDFREGASRRREAPEPATAIEKADVTAAEAHDMVAGLELGNADELADQRLGDEDLAALPFDRARRPYAADLMIGILPGLLDTIRHRMLRGRVDLVWRPLAQSLVRSLLVVMTTEGIKADLLGVGIGGRRMRGLRLEGAMHALMAAVFLRRGRMNEVRFDAELEPPSRQTRQTAGADRAAPLAPFIKRVPANPVAPAQIRNAPVAAIV